MQLERLNYKSAGAVRDRSRGLIPMSGTRIFATEYPKGFQVGTYDADGLVSQPRWFATYDKAQAYAAQISLAAD